MADRALQCSEQRGRYQPQEWAAKAVKAYRHYMGDALVIEVNQGGDMAKSTLRNYDRDVPIKMCHASRGKVTRAEPISALYEQGRVHHVGTFAKLQDQMCAFYQRLQSEYVRLFA